MNSEERLLIELMKGSVKNENYQNIGWDKFIELCYYHRITAFIQEKLNKKLVPKKELEKLNGMNKKILLSNLILNKEMLSLFEELEKRKIDFIVLKGMALNNLLYPKTFSRVSSDIDFLIKEKNYLEIKGILQKKDYIESSFWMGKEPKIHHFPLIRKEVNGLNCVFELHTELFFPFNAFTIDLGEIWKDSIKIGFVSVPSNEDSIIISVLTSVYQHSFHGMLEALIDVRNLLSKKIDYEKLRKKTMKYNVIEPMVYFDELLEEIFGAKIKGIKELEKISDKKKLSHLRKNSLEELIKEKKTFFWDLKATKNRFYWTRNFKQKIKLISFILNYKFFSGIWKIKKVFKKLN